MEKVRLEIRKTKLEMSKVGLEEANVDCALRKVKLKIRDATLKTKQGEVGTMSLRVFTAAGLSAFLVAVLTVGFQALRAATANPVESLRYE